MPKAVHPFVIDIIHKVTEPQSVRDSISDSPIESVDTFLKSKSLPHNLCETERLIFSVKEHVSVWMCMRNDTNTEACGGGQH